MAEGEMLIMVGKEENQNRQKYLKYDKTYEAHILFGFETDTHDILGLIQNSIESSESVNLQNSDESENSEKINLSSKEVKKILKNIKKIKQIPKAVKKE
jgi:tRNA U55 pseudouridine synthase TruB